jgi:hypothetical protein
MMRFLDEGGVQAMRHDNAVVVSRNTHESGRLHFVAPSSKTSLRVRFIQRDSRRHREVIRAQFMRF